MRLGLNMGLGSVATAGGGLSTNLIDVSWEFSDTSYWTIGGTQITMTGGVTDPFGGTAAYSLAYGTTEWAQLISNDMDDLDGYSGDVTLSMFIRNVYKPGTMSLRLYSATVPTKEPRGTFSFVSPTTEGSDMNSIAVNADAVSADFEDYGSGWWRVWVVFNTATISATDRDDWDLRLMPFNGSSDPLNDVQAFGAMVNKGSTPNAFEYTPSYPTS